MKLKVGGMYLTRAGQTTVITTQRDSTFYGYIVGRKHPRSWNSSGKNVNCRTWKFIVSSVDHDLITEIPLEKHDFLGTKEDDTVPKNTIKKELSLKVGGIYLTESGEKVVLTEQESDIFFRGYVIGKKWRRSWDFKGRNFNCYNGDLRVNARNTLKLISEAPKYKELSQNPS